LSAYNSTLTNVESKIKRWVKDIFVFPRKNCARGTIEGGGAMMEPSAECRTLRQWKDVGGMPRAVAMERYRQNGDATNDDCNFPFVDRLCRFANRLRAGFNRLSGKVRRAMELTIDFALRSSVATELKNVHSSTPIHFAL